MIVVQKSNSLVTKNEKFSQLLQNFRVKQMFQLDCVFVRV